jgi:hypothetical protein
VLLTSCIALALGDQSTARKLMTEIAIVNPTGIAERNDPGDIQSQSRLILGINVCSKE